MMRPGPMVRRILIGFLILPGGILLLTVFIPWLSTVSRTEGARPPIAYCPDASVTRAEAAVFVARTWDLMPYEAFTPSFVDVPKGHWAYGYIEALHRAGLASSCVGQPLSYCPNSPITRAEAAKLLVKARGETACPGSTPSFGDVPSDHWAYGYIERALRDGIITTCSEFGSMHLFCPEVALTRAEIAVWIARAKGWSPYDKPTSTFRDVPRTHEAYGYIECLYAEDGTTGCILPVSLPGSAFLGIDWASYYHRYRVAFLTTGGMMGLAILVLVAAKPETGLFLLACVLPFQQREINLGLFSLSVVDFVLWSGIAFWIIRILRQKGTNLLGLLPPTIPPLLIAGVLFLPSFYKAISLSVSLREYIRYLIAVSAYLFVYLHLSRGAKRGEAIKTFLVILLSGGALSVLVLFWEYAHSGIFEFKEFALLNIYRFRQSSFFVDPNYYAEFLVTLVPVSIGLCLTARGKARTLLLANTFLLAMGVLLSFSRSGVLAMLISVVPLLVYLATLHRSAVKPVLIGGVGGLVLSLLLLQLDSVKSRAMLWLELFWTRFVSLSANARGINAFGERLAILQSTVNMIVHNLWFGVGLGNFERQFALYRIGDTGSSYRAAHNTFLRLLAETGVFAFIAYIVFLLLALGYLLKALKVCEDAGWRHILAGLIAGWIGSLVMSLFLDQFVEVYYWIYLGVAMAAARQCERGGDSIAPDLVARGDPQ